MQHLSLIAVTFLIIVTTVISSGIKLEGGVSENHKYPAPKQVEGRIGVRVSPSTGVVVKVQPNSPAAKAGILANDRIITVNGVDHDIKHISGPPGEPVILEFVRNGDLYHSGPIIRVDYRTIQYGKKSKADEELDRLLNQGIQDDEKNNTGVEEDITGA